jgi:hypothetical protein
LNARGRDVERDPVATGPPLTSSSDGDEWQAIVASPDDMLQFIENEAPAGSGNGYVDAQVPPSAQAAHTTRTTQASSDVAFSGG